MIVDKIPPSGNQPIFIINNVLYISDNITPPLRMFPNKRKPKEKGVTISLIIFSGNIIGVGSKKLFK